MNKHQQARDAIAALLKDNRHAAADIPVSVPADLLEEALLAIDTWQMISEEFAKSISVTPGEIKPKIAVDIERFLAAQFTYNREADGVQEGI